MKDRDTPLKLVRKWEKEIPGIYSVLDDLSDRDRGDGLTWPDYCPLPIGAAFTYLVFNKGYSKLNASTVAAEITALWAWRQHKIIYSFDPYLARSLAQQSYDLEDTDVLPSQILMRLPYPCIYIKAPYLLEYTDGFFVWIEYDTNTHVTELRVQWVFQDFTASFPQVLHLLPGKNIGECIADTLATTKENVRTDVLDKALEEDTAGMSRIILGAIQLVLYLVAENSDTQPAEDGVKEKHSTPKAPSAKPRRIEDKASQVLEYKVGIRIGAALRRADHRQASHPGTSTGGSGTTKRSHTRRGHWHHYWTGPKQGQRDLILKWTAPTVIHPEGGGDDAITIVPVK